MVLNLLLAGLVVGRWWLVGIVAVFWPVLLVVGDVGSASDFALVLGGATVGAANTAVGVAVHRLAVVLIRALRRFLTDPIGSLGG